MKFSENLVKLRTSKGMTQQELADQLGITRSAVGNYEQGSRVPDYETLEKVADLFNVDMNSLLGYRISFKSSNVSDEDIKIALWNGEVGMTDAQLDEVRRFAAFIKDRDHG